MIIEGACHCGAVSFTVTDDPTQITDCNCSACRKLGALWLHTGVENARITGDGHTQAYSHGSHTIAFHSCKTCGCTTHWSSLKPDVITKVALNMRLVEPALIADIPVRHFDGADTWAYLD